MSDNKIFRLGICALFMLYSLVTLGIGVWGLNSLPSDCENTDLRTGIRGLIITGAVGATSVISYFLCLTNCKSSTLESEEILMPTWLMSLMLLITLIILTFHGMISKKIDSDDKQCYNDSMDSFRTGNSWGMGFSVLIVIGLMTALGYRAAGYSKRRKAAAAEAATRASQARLAAEQQAAAEKKAAAEKIQQQIDTQKNIEVETLRAQLEGLQRGELSKQAEQKRLETVKDLRQKIAIFEAKQKSNQEQQSAVNQPPVVNQQPAKDQNILMPDSQEDKDASNIFGKVNNIDARDVDRFYTVGSS